MKTKEELTKEELEKVEGGALAPHKKKRRPEVNNEEFTDSAEQNSGPVHVWGD